MNKYFEVAEKTLIAEVTNKESREFPGGLVVKIPGFHCLRPGSICGWGTEIP